MIGIQLPVLMVRKKEEVNMKRIINFILSLVCLIVITACQQDNVIKDSTYLTVTAKMPAEAWGVLSRSEGDVSDIKFHYTPNSANEIYTKEINGNSLNFTIDGLTWSDVKSGSSFYLTCKSGDVEYWGKVENPTSDNAISFGELKPRYAKLTVNVTVEGATNPTVSMTLTRPKVNENSSVEQQAIACSAETEDVVMSNDGTLVAPHNLTDNDKIQFTVNNGSPLTLKLNEVNGFSYIVGTHVTLNVTIKAYDGINLTTPSIVVDSFSDGGNQYFNGKIE